MEYTIALESGLAQDDSDHSHEYHAVVLFLEGDGVYLLDKGVYAYGRGSLLVVPPRTLHMSNRASPAYRLYVVRFPASLLAAVSTEQTDFFPYFSTSRHLRLDEGRLAPVERLMRLAGKGAVPGGFGADIRCRMAFLDLLLALCGCMDAPESGAEPPAVAESRIAPVLAYIQAHIAEPFTLEDVARGLFMSRHHLCRLFRQHTGFTLGGYVIRSRLHRAGELLRSGYGVQRAAEESGFGNYAHFIRAFKRHTGVPPGKYARMVGG